MIIFIILSSVAIAQLDPADIDQCRSDFNADLKVDSTDFQMFSDAFGKNLGDEKYSILYDLDEDGRKIGRAHV